MNERQWDKDAGDIVLKGGSFPRIDNFEDKVLQAVSCFMKTFQGECFSDRDAGVPWFGKILGNDAASWSYIQQVLRERILEVPGVQRVISSSMMFEKRNIKGSFSIELDNGETRTYEV